MRPYFKRINPLFILMAFLMLLPGFVFAQNTPVTKNRLINSLKQLRPGDFQTAIVNRVNSRGVDFELTPDVEAELRAAGARGPLIAAVRAKSLSRKTTPKSVMPAEVEDKPKPGEESYWLTVDTKSVRQLQGYLKKFPNGFYKGLANEKLIERGNVPTRSQLFDSYGNIWFKDEKERLDKFANALQDFASARAYVLAYSPFRDEGLTRADRVKFYLSGRDIDDKRVVVVNGGYRKGLTIDLWLVPAGATPPKPSPTGNSSLIRDAPVSPVKSAGALEDLKISERQVGDVTVLDMNGRITIGQGSVALRSAIRGLVADNKKKILLNLAEVTSIDSSGIGELVSSYTLVNRGNGQLKLLNLTQKLQDLLTITKLLTVFDVYDNEKEALAGFK